MRHIQCLSNKELSSPLDVASRLASTPTQQRFLPPTKQWRYNSYLEGKKVSNEECNPPQKIHLTAQVYTITTASSAV